MLDEPNLDLPEETPAPRSGNRSFVMVAGILGAIMVLALIAMVYYALVILPNQRAAPLPAAQQTQTARALATNTASATNSPEASNTPSATATETLPPPTNTPSPTNTEITPIFTNSVEPATATVNALLTQAALAQTQAASQNAPTSTATTGSGVNTNTPTVTPSALPQSGFAEEVGGPGMLALAGVLVIVIVLARRLRTA
jgi:hypothetical protein